ncbi:hypothetical protein EKH79_14940 [Dyella dinghuensis]|uniref:Uncharacterized protein n=1 Tax=Dyella dinghuensis TaxID=1920169 RepID=A0A432LQ90_9GAMM|nr:hypothetical protein [Dyella dinghuensis]RUL62185.1 hypothetical protein EKH79_14940 [Dyella dinghuensis]
MKPDNPFAGQATTPRFFALAPLYDHLVARQVDIKFLNDDGTLRDGGVATVFTNIDIELWARRFLGDLDRFFVVSAPADVDGQRKFDETFAKALDGRRTVISGITNQLQGVFDYSISGTDPDPDCQKALQAARDALARLLHISLSTAYDISVIVQYDTPSCSDASDVPSSSYSQVNFSNTATAATFAATKISFDSGRALVHFFATPTDSEYRNANSDSEDSRTSGAESATCAHAVSSGHAFSNLHSGASPPGTWRVPVPLRTHPSLPVFREQIASPTFDPPNGLEQLPLWSYKLALVHELASQDTLEITTEFNLLNQPLQHGTASAGTDLFSALAQYIAVADKLWSALGDKSNQSTCYVNATKTFVDLATAIAENWCICSPQNISDRVLNDGSIAQINETLSVRVTYSEDGQFVESVSLIRDQLQFESRNIWPDVEVLLPDGVNVPFLAQESVPSSLNVVYMPKNGMAVPAHARQSLQLTWGGLSVSAFQNARSRMFVVRNEDLLYDSSHPAGSKKSTNPAFLLKTSHVTASSAVAPWIERNHPQDIGGDNLQEALQNAIQTLFPTNGLVANTKATWKLEYSYELTGSDASLTDSSPYRARVPVVFYPNASMAGIAEALASAGQHWIDTYLPAFDKGAWLLNVTLYSGLDSNAHPLFSADLFYPIKR